MIPIVQQNLYYQGLRWALFSGIRAWSRLKDSVAGRETEHMRPDFLIVGAMKSGTSTLYSWITQHPGILAASTKEVQYFNNFKKFARGEHWYLEHFPRLSEAARVQEELGYPPVTGEATPQMHLPLYTRHAARLLPDAKIIMILRDPVERAYSHYQHNLRRNLIGSMSFYEALMEERRRLQKHGWLLQIPYLEDLVLKTHWGYLFTYRGKYLEQIKRWMDYYSGKQLLIINFSDLRDDPEETLNRITGHLGLPEHTYSTDVVKNVGGYQQPMDEECRVYLTEFFRPHNKKLFEFLHEDWGWPS